MEQRLRGVAGGWAGGGGKEMEESGFRGNMAACRDGRQDGDDREQLQLWLQPWVGIKA